MGAQLSLKAALPLAERLGTASDRCSKTGPRAPFQCNDSLTRYGDPHVKDKTVTSSSYL